MARAQTLGGLKLHKRIGADLDSFGDIEKFYDQELSATPSQLDSRGVSPNRERWDDYVAAVRKLYGREAVIRDSGFVANAAGSALEPLSDAPLMRGQREAEVFGKGLPPKTIVFTFDDAPHPRYTARSAPSSSATTCPARSSRSATTSMPSMRRARASWVRSRRSIDAC